jgi:hypothetical protein
MANELMTADLAKMLAENPAAGRDLAANLPAVVSILALRELRELMAERKEADDKKRSNGTIHVNTGEAPPQFFPAHPLLQGPKPPKDPWHERFRGVLVLLALAVSSLLVVLVAWALVKAPAPPAPPTARERPEMQPTREALARLEAVTIRVGALSLKAQARKIPPPSYDARRAAYYRSVLVSALDRERPVPAATLHQMSAEIESYQHLLDVWEGQH